MSDPQPNTVRLWGYILPDDTFCPLPMQPMLGVGMGAPPFDVTLPSGEVRHVVEAPEE